MKEWYKKLNIIAIVVSYNRSELLKKSLESIKLGYLIPTKIIVVNNASEDNTLNFLNNYFTHISLKVINLSHNTGGAGGFTVGIMESLKENPDLIWLIDDDAIPQRGCLYELVQAWYNYSEIPACRPAFVSSKILWHDDSEHPANTPRSRFHISSNIPRKAKKLDARSIRSASFVSLLIDIKDIRKGGLPIAAYFLWNDDFEYTTRLSKYSIGLSANKSKVLHMTKEFNTKYADPGKRFFLEVRNKLWMFKYSQSLTFFEKIIYIFFSITRWSITIVKSKSPLQLFKYLLDGIVAAYQYKPESNEKILKNIYHINHKYSSCKELLDYKFSVLLPIYKNDKLEFFKRAFQSITKDQTLKPNEILLIQDGPIDKNIEEEINKIKKQSNFNVLHYTLKEPTGLSAALNIGLKKCSYEIIARMDSDDISLPTRFEKQISYIKKGADIVGSSLQEFYNSETNIITERVVESDPNILKKRAKFISPFYHPTVMYKKSKIMSVGGYYDLDSLEDYWLWVRLMESKAVVANIVEPLLLYRVSDGAYSRRGGVKVFISEVKLQNKLLKIGFINNIEWIRNVSIRGIYRFIPEKIRKSMYRIFFTHTIK